MSKDDCGANIKLSSLTLLKDMESYSEFCKRVSEIRELFSFSSTVLIEEVPSLHALEKKCGCSLPSWVIGLSAGRRIWIVSKSQWENQKIDMEQLILHEFVHIVLNSSVKEELPLWINEGLAVYLSGQYQDYKLEQSHIRAFVDFYELSYGSENLYIIVAKMVVALMEHYGESFIVKELLECKNFQTSKIFCNENLNQKVMEY